MRAAMLSSTNYSVLFRFLKKPSMKVDKGENYEIFSFANAGIKGIIKIILTRMIIIAAKKKQ